MKNNKSTPPLLAGRILLWFLKDELAEEVLGDLDEKFYYTLKSHSSRRAKINYWYQVFNYLRPFALKNYRSNNSNNYTMLQSYFKIGFRNLVKNRGYSAINIGGLAIGMSVAILIGLWVHDELSFNKFHNNYDKVAQIYFYRHVDESNIETNRVVPTGLGTALQTSFPAHFESVALIRARLEERLLTAEDNNFVENGYFIQPAGPAMFGLKMAAGSIDGLTDMRSILLSESTARKMFGDEDAINKVVRFDEQVDLQVTGVYEDLPKNTQFSEAAYLAPLDLYLYGWSNLNIWDNYNMYAYVQLRDGVNIEQANKAIENVWEPHLQDHRKQDLFLHPMHDWHLYSKFDNGQRVTSERLIFVWLYSAIGTLVLLLACVNFMNLSTAKSENRAKEIGVRKSMGSARKQLITQFLSESILVSVLALVISLVTVAVSLNGFNYIAGKSIQLPWSAPYFWITIIGFTIFTGLLAGSYPALYLSSFNPIKSLKGSFKTGKYASFPRKVLVVFQFTVSIALVIGTVIIYQQIEHVKDRPTGYVRDGLLMMSKRSSELYGKFNVLRTELLKTGVVEEIAEANYPLTNTLGNNNGFNWEGRDPNSYHSFNTIRVSRGYGKTVDWELVQGRDFSQENKSDLTSVIITESALESMKIENPIGMRLDYKYGMSGNYTFTIVGVVKDLIKGDPFQAARPAIMFLTDEEETWQFIRIKENTPQNEAITKIDDAFRKVAPSAYIDYKLMGDEYAFKFKSEERIGRLARFFTILAIIISCLGLFGLAAFMAQKRTKEIGIRKVLGATVMNLWKMLSTDFIILVVIACLIATPVAYYFLNEWLQQYEYHINISWWVFFTSGIGAIFITIATVSYQAINAATANPVDSLRIDE